ncbi:MAG: tetratricopeptide repeat protein [Bacteroidales bacterium]|nr:tetratricopeptide repeat protein [Bacteroidales bacterium]MCF8327950.1 tetratricopeptide repeat protein [Bacteroidales bacterium]
MNLLKEILVFILLMISVNAFCVPPEGNPEEQSFNKEQVRQTVDSIYSRNPEAAIAFLHSHRKKNTIKKEDQVFLHNQLGKYYYEQGHSDSAKYYYEKAVEIAENQNLERQKYKQIAELAFFYSREGQYERAGELYKTAIDYFRKNNDSILLGTTLSSYGGTLDASGQKKAAYKAYQEAIPMLENTEKHLNLGTVYENIANINADFGYENRYIANIKQAIEAYKKLEDKRFLAEAYAGMGVSFKKNKSYDSALYYYKKSDSIAVEKNYPGVIARNAMNKGNIFDSMGDKQKAFRMYQKSLELSKKHNLLYGQYVNYSNLGDWYKNAGNYNKAVNLMEQALTISRKYNFPERNILLNNLAKAHAQIKDFQGAYQYMQMYANYTDSLYKEKKHKELMDLQTKYETKKKEAEILQLEKENKQEKLDKTYITAAALLIVLLLTGITVWFYQKRKIAIQKAQIVEKENENIKAKLEIKNKDLISNSLHLANLQEFAQDLSGRLRKLKPYIQKQGQKELQEILDMLKKYSNQDKLWEDFDHRFKELNPQFLNRLLSYCPDLTTAEVRLCSMLYLNMNTKEIASVTNRSTRTVENLRYRVRNKLNLSKDDNLTAWLYKL